MLDVALEEPARSILEDAFCSTLVTALIVGFIGWYAAIRWGRGVAMSKARLYGGVLGAIVGLGIGFPMGCSYVALQEWHPSALATWSAAIVSGHMVLNMLGGILCGWLGSRMANRQQQKHDELINM